jgi:hypothetical protein
MSEIRKLYRHEALALRSEHDGRIKTLRDCLQETRQNRDRLSFARQDEGRRRPSPDFDLAEARKNLRNREFKRRKLNAAIQETNYKHRIDFAGESMNPNEALEMRKGLNERIGELHTQVVKSAYQRVIYKEGRDIVEENEVAYADSVKNLEDARLAIRDLNRKIRRASFEAVVDFQDESHQGVEESYKPKRFVFSLRTLRLCESQCFLAKHGENAKKSFKMAGVRRKESRDRRQEVGGRR